MLHDTLFNWLLVVNAAVAARGIWICSNSFRAEAEARQLQAEANMLCAQIESEKWEKLKLKESNQ
ncbi:hypothetical protein J8F10_09260 [Gemmata sp. G18]|uniref:Uncharacterized protein n=1 Tax=Gemmata palustris TaxID=2822762 RepID=A0ABS5BRG9_9BACT|nr:hypothetical protein [Gemmata palustris]MBP3955468.1 hypothetical protein [Gemmata palustris]